MVQQPPQMGTPAPVHRTIHNLFHLVSRWLPHQLPTRLPVPAASEAIAAMHRGAAAGVASARAHCIMRISVECSAEELESHVPRVTVAHLSVVDLASGGDPGAANTSTGQPPAPSAATDDAGRGLAALMRVVSKVRHLRGRPFLLFLLFFEDPT